MKSRDLDPVFGAVADYFSMLAEPARLKIMHTLCHLGLMHRHGVVERRRASNLVYYRVADETMPELCRVVCERIARTLEERQPLRRRLLRLVPGIKRHPA